MRVVIYGSRPDGHAKVIVDLFGASGELQFAGLVDDLPRNAARTVRGLAVLGDATSLPALEQQGVEGVVLGFGEHRGRAQACKRVLAAGLSLPVLVHPSAVVSPTAVLGAGAQILPLAFVGPDASVGTGALVNTGAIIEHDVQIADGVVVGPHATLNGRATVQQDAQIGAGATVLPDRRVGAGAIVGAGAVVTVDVAPGEVVVGVPARQPTPRSS